MNKEPLEAMLAVLPHRASKADAVALLKDREKPHSSKNWSHLVEARLKPALDEGAIDEEDLIALWRSGERGVGFHVFLYQCDANDARSRISRPEISRLLAAKGLTTLLDRPLPVYEPRSPKIVDVRWEHRGKSLVVRVEERRHYERHGKLVRQNGFYERQVEHRFVAAMNFLEIHDDGLIELRVQSHPSWAPGKVYPDYLPQIGRMKKALEAFLEGLSCEPLSLLDAKTELWQKRRGLEGNPRFSFLRLRNDEDVSERVAAGGQGEDLADSLGARKAVDAFLKNDDGHCEEISLWWFDVTVSLPFKADNEMAIGRDCPGGSYERILEGVLSHT